MAEMKSGASADNSLWTQTLYGLDYFICPGMTTADVVAADASALTISASPMMVLVDPYSNVKTNGVVVRAETSSALIVNDANAVGIASLATE